MYTVAVGFGPSTLCAKLLPLGGVDEEEMSAAEAAKLEGRGISSADAHRIAVADENRRFLVAENKFLLKAFASSCTKKHAASERKKTRPFIYLITK